MHLARPTLGTAQFGTAYGIANRRERLPDTEVDRILRTAFERGVRSLDTAPDYDDAEARIGDFLAREGRPDGLEMCTKLPGLPPGIPHKELTQVVEAAVEASRRRLRSDVIDHLLLHRPADLQEHGAALVDTLLACRTRGWIRKAGVSVYDPEEAARCAAWVALESVQFPFNVLDHRMRDSGVLHDLKHAGRVTFGRSPLLQGVLAMPLVDLPVRLQGAAEWLGSLQDLARRNDRDPVAIAFAFSAGQPGIDHVVFGVDGHAQLERALDAMQRPLPAALRAEIDETFAHVPREVRDPRQWDGAR